MKKLFAVCLGLGAFIAFAFQSPDVKKTESILENEVPLVITLDGIQDGVAYKINTEEFLVETD